MFIYKGTLVIRQKLRYTLSTTHIVKLRIKYELSKWLKREVGSPAGLWAWLVAQE